MIFSIVIPVYNVENYIIRCLDSIVKQKYTDYEIILVDDGSKDGSPALCDMYSENFDNIRVIHQINAGLSKARNVGIDNASGEYIMFVDSDDWIDDGCLKKFEDIINSNKTDLIVGKAKAIDDYGNTTDKSKYTGKCGVYSIESYLKYLKKNNGYSACAQFTLCRTEFLNKNNIRFKEKIIHEDELWTPSVLIRAKDIYYSDVYFYYHYMRAGSITRSSNFEQSGMNLLIVTTELKKLLAKCDIEGIEIIRDKMVTLYLQAICLVNDYSGYILSTKYLRRNAFLSKTKIKIALFSVSPKLYLMIHKLIRR